MYLNTLKELQQFRTKTHVSIISDSMQVYVQSFLLSFALKKSTNISSILASTANIIILF